MRILTLVGLLRQTLFLQLSFLGRTLLLQTDLPEHILLAVKELHEGTLLTPTGLLGPSEHYLHQANIINTNRFTWTKRTLLTPSEHY